MSELRWNPIKREWVITAAHRQKRTYKPPTDFCPLCPTEEGAFPTEVLRDDYDIVVFENKFPALQKEAPEPVISASKLYKVKKAQGICEVVLFSSEHDGIMSKMPLSRYLKLVKVWRDRYQELASKEFIDYVYIFENKGEEVGVTLEHPHGQIYAYPFIPPFIKEKQDSSHEHYEKTGNCLFCDVLAAELYDGRRIVAENDSFLAFIPFFARYTYEVNIFAKKHLPSFNYFTYKEEEDLARILKIVLMKYDNLFSFIFPYVMGIHQQPSAGKDDAEYSHFHIEFFPPYRTEDKLKYLSGSELGTGIYINGSYAEDKAKELRNTEPIIIYR